MEDIRIYSHIFVVKADQSDSNVQKLTPVLDLSSLVNQNSSLLFKSCGLRFFMMIHTSSPLHIYNLPISSI